MSDDSREVVVRGGWLHAPFHRLAVVFAYAGGIVVAVIGLMSAFSIVRRAVFGRPILGDFELVEIGIAVAGTLFLAYCQITAGHIFVDVFTLRAGKRAQNAMYRIGAFVMALMFFLVVWRAAVGAHELKLNGETSMLLGFPIWAGYAGMIPGMMLAAFTALGQALGWIGISRRVEHEQS